MTSTTNAMSRDDAGSRPGVLVQGVKPRNDGDIITVIGALTVNGLKAVMMVRGGTTKEAFRVYTSQVLDPELCDGDIVIMDKLAAHQDLGVRDPIESKGARAGFEPPYSPELDPIETAWAWLEWWLGIAGARTEEPVNNAIALALDVMPPKMARGWIRACGTTAQPSGSAQSGINVDRTDDARHANRGKEREKDAGGTIPGWLGQGACRPGSRARSRSPTKAEGLRRYPLQTIPPAAIAQKGLVPRHDDIGGHAQRGAWDALRRH